MYCRNENMVFLYMFKNSQFYATVPPPYGVPPHLSFRGEWGEKVIPEILRIVTCCFSFQDKTVRGVQSRITHSLFRSLGWYARHCYYSYCRWIEKSWRRPIFLLDVFDVKSASARSVMEGCCISPFLRRLYPRQRYMNIRVGVYLRCVRVQRQHISLRTEQIS